MSSIDDLFKGFFSNGFLGSGFISYIVSEIYEQIPLYTNLAFTYFQEIIFPALTRYSSVVLLGVVGASMLSSLYMVSETINFSKKKLLKLAYDSKLDPEFIDNLRREIPRKFENIYVFNEKKLSQAETERIIDQLFDICGLNEPHYGITGLVSSLRKLNYYISFHDYSEITIKEKMLESGWNFNLVNQAFMVIDMELCNEIGGAYFVTSTKDIAKSMKYMKELAARGYTSSKIKSYLVSNGAKECDINKILSKIHKVQELHTKAKQNHETKIRRALRLNMAHPSILTTGNYNS